MKRIKLELTEDQKQYLLGLVMVDEHQLTVFPRNNFTPQEAKDYKAKRQALAFTRRVKSLLLEAKS